LVIIVVDVVIKTDDIVIEGFKMARDNIPTARVAQAGCVSKAKLTGKNRPHVELMRVRYLRGELDL
jgi:hypothetical protein